MKNWRDLDVSFLWLTGAEQTDWRSYHLRIGRRCGLACSGITLTLLIFTSRPLLYLLVRLWLRSELYHWQPCGDVTSLLALWLPPILLCLDALNRNMCMSLLMPFLMAARPGKCLWSCLIGDWWRVSWFILFVLFRVWFVISDLNLKLEWLNLRRNQELLRMPN